jgi:hypothetical protein
MWENTSELLRMTHPQSYPGLCPGDPLLISICILPTVYCEAGLCVRSQIRGCNRELGAPPVNMTHKMLSICVYAFIQGLGSSQIRTIVRRDVIENIVGDNGSMTAPVPADLVTGFRCTFMIFNLADVWIDVSLCHTS